MGFFERLNQGSSGDKADYRAGAGADDQEKAHKDAVIKSTMIGSQVQAYGVMDEKVRDVKNKKDERNK